MLILVYDLKCGFFDKFITERSVELDITYVTDPANYEPDAVILNEQEFFDRYVMMPELMFTEYPGLADMLRGRDIDRCMHTYFKDMFTEGMPPYPQPPIFERTGVSLVKRSVDENGEIINDDEVICYA